MPLRIEIPDSNIEYLTKEAKLEIEDSTLRYANGVIKEAGRIEAQIRIGDGNPEITRTIIKHAVDYQNNPYYRPKKSKAATIFQLVSAITTFLSGNTLTYWAVDTSNNTVIWIFGVTSFVAIVTTILSFVWRNK